MQPVITNDGWNATGAGAAECRRRIALVISSYQQPRWVANLIAEIAKLAGLELAGVIITEGDAKCERMGARALLYRVLRAVDSAFFGRQAGALEVTDISPLLAPVPKFSLSSETASAMGRQNSRPPFFDIALDRSGGRAPAHLLDSLAVETWTYGVAGEGSADSAALEGWLKRAPVLSMELVSRSRSGRSILFETHSAVDRWSNLRTLSNCYQKAPAIITGQLGAAEPGTPHLITRKGAWPVNREPAPSNMQSARMLGLVCPGYVRERAERALYVCRWGLAFAPLSACRAGHASFQSTEPPAGRFWADPFLVKRHGRTLVFFEEYVSADRKGRIMAAECDESGLKQEPVCVLERPYHLSYPLIFEAGGAIYMMPETRRNRTIEIYACTSFPGKWELCRTLFHGLDASDPTPACINGRWWLFTNIGMGACAYDDLYLFHAADPLGTWTPHRGNPVKSDVRSGRSAGRIVFEGGKVFRLSQDCSRRYGSAINAHQIVELTPVRYEERPAGRMSPASSSRMLLGVHTANAAGNLLVIDGLVRRSRFLTRPTRNAYRGLRVSGFHFWFGGGASVQPGV